MSHLFPKGKAFRFFEFNKIEIKKEAHNIVSLTLGIYNIYDIRPIFQFCDVMQYMWKSNQ